MRSDSFEPLESRRLLSAVPVTAKLLAGPLAAGDTFNYQQFVGPKVTAVRSLKVAGPATFNHNKATQVNETITSANFKAIDQRFESLDSKLGLLLFGAVNDATSGKFETTTTITDSPAQVVAPPTLVAGKTYTSTFNQTVVTVRKPGKLTTTVHRKDVWSIKLVSASPQSVTVPAGKFSAYEVVTTDSITVNGQTTSSTAKAWFAPGVGLIKTLTGVGATAVSEVLTSYKIK